MKEGRMTEKQEQEKVILSGDIRERIVRLRTIDPEHDSLRFAELFEDENFSQGMAQEFFAEFNVEDGGDVDALVEYLAALEDALMDVSERGPEEFLETTASPA